MIALLTTYFIVSYVLVPGVLFRVLAGLLVQLRLFQLTRTQEVTLGVLVAVAPLLGAWFFVWHVPIAQNHPFSYAFGTVDEYGRDYRLALTLAVSSDPEKLLQPDQVEKTAYGQAISRVWHRQLRFLCWYYIFSGVEGLLFGYLGRQYGDWSGKNRFYDWLARRVLLPHISEWQLLLTDFTFPKKPKREVSADILCEEILYRGKIGDYFINTNGQLSGIFLKDVARFRKDDFKAACEKAAGTKIDREKYWRTIPGANFYIPADRISNLNARFQIESQELPSYLTDFLEKLDLPTKVTVTYGDTSNSHDEPAIPSTPATPNQTTD